jgi:hypothetical protein
VELCFAISVGHRGLVERNVCVAAQQLPGFFKRFRHGIKGRNRAFYTRLQESEQGLACVATYVDEKARFGCPRNFAHVVERVRVTADFLGLGAAFPQKDSAKSKLKEFQVNSLDHF